MTKPMPRPDPRLVLFLPGHSEGESELSFARSFADQIPWEGCRVVAVTGNPDYRARWGEDAVHVPREFRRRLPIVHESRWLVMRAMAEGLLDEADVVVSTSWYRALMTWIVGTDETVRHRGYRGARIRPIVYLCPQVNDQWEREIPNNNSWWRGHRYPDDLWWMTMASWPNLHSVHPGAWDADEALRKLRRLSPNPPLERAHVWERWEYGGPVAAPRREAKVVWASRLSPLKDPALAAQIGHLLLGLGRSFEAYAVSARTNSHDVPKLTVGLPQEVFWEKASGAMVHLLTSHREAGVLVLWELAERGVVPVVRDRPWARRALPDWPLLFRTAGEAVVLCEKVLDHYDYWRQRLEEMLRLHYRPGAVNGAQVWEAIWREWVTWSYQFDVTTKTEQPKGVQQAVRQL